jgi:hypothetical protein
MKKQHIKFRAVKVIPKTTKVEFFTKEGESVFFKATTVVEDPEELRTKDLIRWLGKNGFKELAKALKKATSFSRE